MDLLMKHGEKLVTVIILLGCAMLLLQGLGSGSQEEIEAVKKAKDAINVALKTNQVDPAWPFSEQNQVAHANHLEKSINRPQAGLQNDSNSYSFYPRPDRPFVDKSLLPSKMPKKVIQEIAALAAPVELVAKAEHGTIWVACRVPRDKFKHFETVRVEFYRGETAKKVETKVGDRIPAFARNVVAAPEKEDDKEKDPSVDSGIDTSGMTAREKKRLEGKESDEPEAEAEAAPKGNEENSSGGEDLPDEFKSLVVFQDINVDPKKSYFYKARIIARLKANDQFIAEVKRNGEPIKVNVPEGLTPVAAPAGRAGKYYASGFTTVIESKTPPNFTVRFQSIVKGALPDPDARIPRPPEYTGSFELRVWVPQFKEYHDIFVYADIGKPLQISKRVRSKQSKEQILFKFDTGLILEEVVQKNTAKKRLVERVIMEEKKDPNTGAISKVPVIDPKTGRPKMEEIEVEGTPIKTLVARLKDAKSGEIEEHPQRKNFERRKDSFKYFDRIRREQEALDKKQRDRLKNRPKKK